MDGGELVSPLIYSTAFARSVRIGHPRKLEHDDGEGQATLDGKAFEQSRLHFSEAKPGGFAVYANVNGQRFNCRRSDLRSRQRPHRRPADSLRHP